MIRALAGEFVTPYHGGMRTAIALAILVLSAACATTDDVEMYDGPRCADAWVTVEDECADVLNGGEDVLAQCITREIGLTFAVDEGCDGQCKAERGSAYHNVDTCVWDVSGYDGCTDKREACEVE